MDDYNIFLGLNFLDKINILLVPFADYMCIFNIQQQCVVLKSRDMRGGMKETYKKMLEKQKIDMKPMKLLDGTTT